MFERLLRIKEVVGDKKANPPVPGLLPIGKSQFWAGVRSGKYPAPIKLGPRTTCWKLSDILLIVEQGVSEKGGSGHEKK
jgi:prophage regulatory protein